MDDEKLSLISLNTIVELTPRKIISLINYFGSAKNIFVADVKELKSFDISDKGIQAVKSVSDFEVANKELVLAEKNSVKIVTYLDEDYPHQLKRSAAHANCCPDLSPACALGAQPEREADDREKPGGKAARQISRIRRRN